MKDVDYLSSSSNLCRRHKETPQRRHTDKSIRRLHTFNHLKTSTVHTISLNAASSVISVLLQSLISVSPPLASSNFSALDPSIFEIPSTLDSLSPDLQRPKRREAMPSVKVLTKFGGDGACLSSGRRSGRQAAVRPTETSAVVQKPGGVRLLFMLVSEGWKETGSCQRPLGRR